MDTKKRYDLKIGTLSAEVLQIACANPEAAYPHAITRELNERHGAKYTHALDVGRALEFLVEAGALVREENNLRKCRGAARKLYTPTGLGGLYVGLGLQFDKSNRKPKVAKAA